MSTTYRVPGAVFTEREHRLPLDHMRPDGPHITVFTREVTAPGGEDLPYLVFLQGGPGMEAARPTSPPSGWMKRAIENYRVLLLDQRGTGRSSPVGSSIPGATPEDQAAYLAHFRADAIVRDAELIRQELGVDRWSLLGQSFGGFTSLTYLSFAPEGLREALITGGLTPVGRPPDDIYGATYVRLIEKHRAYFERYPGDRARLRDVVRRLDDEEIRLPSGDRLTGRRFRQLGLMLGDSAGFELIHHILELPFGSNAFLHDAEQGVHFSRNPLYATLHESSYADGFATRWSAARLLPDEVEAEGYLTAEHVFPWMWEDYGTLRPHQRRRGDPRRTSVAPPVRRGAAAPQRGARRGDDLRQRPLRGARIRPGDGGPRQGPSSLGDERVRAQRAARRRRASARPAHRSRSWPMKPFRFLADASEPIDGRTLVEAARRAEAIGYAALVFPDHLLEQLAPVPAMAMVAAVTTRLRISAFVINNDLRHPAVLAHDLATLDLLSGGRLDVALGAGWNRPEYDAVGLPFDPVGTRVSRLEEAIAVLKGAFGDEPFSHMGEHYTITDFDGRPKPLQRPHPPFFVGGGGRRVLSLAAREADTVGLAPRTRSGQRTDPLSITLEATAEKIEWVRAGCGRPVRSPRVQRLPVGLAGDGDGRRALRGAAGHRPIPQGRRHRAHGGSGSRVAAHLRRFDRRARREVPDAPRTARDQLVHGGWGRRSRSGRRATRELGDLLAPVVARTSAADIAQHHSACTVGRGPVPADPT